MLTIRLDNGRMKYSYQPKKYNTLNDARLSLAPLPSLYYNETKLKRLKLQKWYNKYYQYVDDITDILLEAFTTFLENHPIYHVSIDEDMLRYRMVHTLYKTSFSAFRNFP
jgi:hypothetical protein